MATIASSDFRCFNSCHLSQYQPITTSDCHCIKVIFVLILSTQNHNIKLKVISCLESEAPLSSGVGDGEEGEEVAAEAEEDVERVEDHGEGRGALASLSWEGLAFDVWDNTGWSIRLYTTFS